MCGIAGFLTYSPEQEPRTILERMTSSIRHRGPDADGFYCDRPAFLGHRRLSIIDLAAGAQPMTSETGDRWIVYNGEIFNHASLRPGLEAAGHRYTTHCDTETILHAYEQYGPECVAKFRGMFSFALWDKAANTLFCARDRLGIKPFYYFWDGRLFVFASEIKAILEHPAVSASLNEKLLPEYLAFGFGSSEETLFAGIRKLMPGHYLTITAEAKSPRLKISRYWDPPAPAAATDSRSEQQCVDECRARLEETVRMRLMSDVPVGMFLSGGVDSSAIAALMRRMMDSSVKTFSVGYGENAFSELSYARQVAEFIGTDHQEVIVGMDDFFNALPQLIWHEDEPITWPSSVSLYFVSKLAAKKVKVVLTGEGSDELFAGYERYQHYLFNSRGMSLYRLVPGPLRSLVRSQIASSNLLSASLRRKIRHTFIGREDSFESLQLDNFYCAFSAAEQRGLLSGSLDSASAYANFLHYWNSQPQASTLARMLYTDQKTYLVQLLMKQDRMSMAASIESRVPFLDHTFVEFAAGLPANLKIHGGEAKYVFKKAVENLLPREIVYRKKMGFPTPLRQWLLDSRAVPLFDLLRSPSGLLAGYLDLHQLDQLLDRHRRGLEDATDRIWRLINLQLWGECFLSGNRGRWTEGLMAGAGVRGRS